VEWSRALGGSGNETAYSAAPSPDGGAVLALGSSSPDGDFGPALGEFDAWIVKIGADGTLGWKTAMSGSGYDDARWVARASDGGWLALGKSDSPDGPFGAPRGRHGAHDWAGKLDPSGRLLWVRFLDSQSNGPLNLRAAPLPDGGMLVVSAVWKDPETGAAGCGSGERGLRSWRLSDTGEAAEAFCAPLDLSEDFAVAHAPGGGIAVAYRPFDDPDSRSRIAALSPAGEVLWDVRAGNAEGSGHSLSVGLRGGWVGSTANAYGSWLFGVGSDGSGAWSSRVPGNGWVSEVVPAAGGMLAVGTVPPEGGGDGGDEGDLQAFLTDRSGNVLWSAVMGGSATDAGLAAADLSEGGHLVAGSTESRDGALESVTPPGLPDRLSFVWVVKFKL
jgi:hypothetical protein